MLTYAHSAIFYLIIFFVFTASITASNIITSGVKPEPWLVLINISGWELRCAQVLSQCTGVLIHSDISSHLPAASMAIFANVAGWALRK